MNDLQQTSAPTASQSVTTVDQFLKLDRLERLALNHDGSRLVGVVDRLDDSNHFQSTLYEVETSGTSNPKILSKRAGKVTALCFGTDDSLYFSESRVNEPGQGLIVLDASGKENVIGLLEKVRTLTPIPGTNHILVSCRQRIDGNEARQRFGGSLLHSHYPVRVDDSNDIERVQLHIVDTHTGAVGKAHENTKSLWAESEFIPVPSGTAVLANRRRFDRGEIRIDLVLVDLWTGDETVLHREDERRLLAGPISPDGTRAAVQRVHLDGSSERRSLAVVDLKSGSLQPLASTWDRWGAPLAWFPNGQSVLVRADENGATPFFRVEIAAGKIERLTHDQGAYDSAFIHPTGHATFAIRSSIQVPGEAVRIVDAAARPLGIPHARPAFPGTSQAISVRGHDGAEIHCQLILPDVKTSMGAAPLIVWVHGGPAVSWSGWRWARSPWPLIAQGIAVLMPDIAMSTGYGQDFIDRGWGDWGGAPLRDLVDVTRQVGDRPDIDADRIAVAGTSFGGYLASWAAANSGEFRVAVAHAPVWDLDLFHPTTDDPARFRRRMEWDKRTEHSPRWKVESISIPMLVSQGGQDTCVPREQAFLQWSELISRSALAEDEHGQTPHRFLYMPEEGHRISTPQGTRAWYEALLGFFNEHLLGRDPRYPRELLQYEEASPAHTHV